MTGTADSDASGVRRASDDARPAADAAGPLIVYCGGCNPQIDRGAVAGELEAAPTFARSGVALYLSGCPRACASDHQLSTGGPAVVVAGAHVDGVPTPAQDIAAAVIDKLKE